MKAADLRLELQLETKFYSTEASDPHSCSLLVWNVCLLFRAAWCGGEMCVLYLLTILISGWICEYLFATMSVNPKGANISGGHCISVLVELKRHLHNTGRAFQWLSQIFHSNITSTCCSVILMPAASIYTGALALSSSEEKQTQTLVAVKNITAKVTQ